MALDLDLCMSVPVQLQYLILWNRAHYECNPDTERKKKLLANHKYREGIYIKGGVGLPYWNQTCFVWKTKIFVRQLQDGKLYIIFQYIWFVIADISESQSKLISSIKQSFH